MSDDDPRNAGGTDELLNSLVTLINAGTIDLSISLLQGGAWISGLAIAPRVWIEEVAQQIDVAVQGVGEAFRIYGRVVHPAEVEVQAGVAEPIRQDNRYLHLRDARRFPHHPRVTFAGNLVRVRVDRIDGWAVGQLGPEGYRAPPPPRPPGG